MRYCSNVVQISPLTGIELVASILTRDNTDNRTLAWLGSWVTVILNFLTKLRRPPCSSSLRLSDGIGVVSRHKN